MLNSNDRIRLSLSRRLFDGDLSESFRNGESFKLRPFHAFLDAYERDQYVNFLRCDLPRLRHCFSLISSRIEWLTKLITFPIIPLFKKNFFFITGAMILINNQVTIGNINNAPSDIE